MLYKLCVLLLAAASTSSGQQLYRPAVAPADPQLSNDNRSINNILVLNTNSNLDPNNNLVSSETIVPSIPDAESTTPIDPDHDSITEPARDVICSTRFGYHRIMAKCDSYIECRNYRAFVKLCPDGMNFNVNARWPEYPCGYPMDAPCIDQGVNQPAKPSAECPHQYGFFPINDNSLNLQEKCSRYLICAEGQARQMDCPFGLAFDPAGGKCDWPELVPSCKDYLGFTCPATPLEEDGQSQGIIQNYKYNDDECYYFWSCQEGHARVLSCDFGLAFDPNLGRCVDEDMVRCTDNNRRH